MAMDSDIRTYTMRDPRGNNSNAAVPVPTATQQLPPQSVQPARPQAQPQSKPPVSSTDTEKVICIRFRLNKKNCAI